MLKKQNRVGRKTIEQIFKKGLFLYTPNLTFKFIKSPNLNTKAVSFLTPKGINKKAVKRNSLRRRGYSILRKNWDLFPNNIEGVFIFNKKGVESFMGRKTKNHNPIQNLENEIKNIINKIN